MDEDWTLGGAQRAAGEGRLPEWVGGFLAATGNLVLAAALAQRPHWWLGPVRLPLAELRRLAGPEPDAVCPIPAEQWEADVAAMVASLGRGWVPPPLLVEARGERLLVQDGSHRFAALVRAGAHDGWVILYGDDPADRDRCCIRLGISPDGPLPPAGPAR